MLIDKGSQVCSKMQEFMVLGQIRKFCQSRSGCEKFTGLIVVNSKDTLFVSSLQCGANCHCFVYNVVFESFYFIAVNKYILSTQVLCACQAYVTSGVFACYFI